MVGFGRLILVMVDAIDGVPVQACSVKSDEVPATSISVKGLSEEWVTGEVEYSHPLQIVKVEVTGALKTVVYVEVTVVKSEVIVAVTVLVVSVSYVTTVVVDSRGTEVTIGPGAGVVLWETEVTIDSGIDVISCVTEATIVSGAGVVSCGTEVTIGSEAGVVSEKEAVGLLLICWGMGTPTVEVMVIVESELYVVVIVLEPEVMVEVIGQIVVVV